MPMHKIGIRNSLSPILITEDILKNVIVQIGTKHSKQIELEWSTVVDIPYFKYLINVFRSNPEYARIFKVVQKIEHNEIEVICSALRSQFEMLQMDDKSCFDKVKLKRVNKYIIYYVFICSSGFYQVCHEDIGNIDTSRFMR